MLGADDRPAEPMQRWIRAEHAALVVVLSAFVLVHAGGVAWGRFAAAFALIDLVGYAPGAIAFRLARGGRIAPCYHHLYNLTHSYLVAGVGIALWTMATGRTEWAMLAVPIHLSGDRGLLGNFFKPASLPFDSPARALRATRSTNSAVERPL
jgi:hypothetical protein